METGSTSCPRCGAANSLQARFCQMCGAPLEPRPAPSAGDEPLDSGEGDAVSGPALTWEYAFPLLTNRFVLWDFLKVMAISLVLFYLLLAVVGLVAARELVVLPITFVGLIFAILGVIMVFVMLVIFQNRFHATFTIDAEGAGIQTGSRERKLNRIALIIGVLGRSPGAVGASLLARSQETIGINWQDVYRVGIHPRQRAISLSNSWRTVVRLYCPPQVFGQAVELVQAYATEGAEWRARHPKEKVHLRDLWPYLAWSGLAVLATFASLFWETEEVYTFALAAGLLVLLSRLVEGYLRRAVALMGVVIALFFLGRIASLALKETVYTYGAFKLFGVYGYEREMPLLLVAIAGGLVLLAMSGIRLLRGRS